MRPECVARHFPVFLALSIQDVLASTPRTRVLRVSLDHHSFPYRAGKSVLVGLHGQQLRRHYSLADAPEHAATSGYLELLVKHEGDGAGPHLPTLEPGTVLDIEGPIGTLAFPDPPLPENLLFVAGGTGIAPVRAMIRHALLHRFPGRLSLLYSARTPDEFPFEQELMEIARSGALDLVQTVTREADLSWTGQRGRITAQHLAALVRDASAMCFVCGPPPFLDTIGRALEDLGIPPSKILKEEED